MAQAPANWEHLKTIVADALELAAAEREAYLTSKCGQDPALLSEARALVTASEQADGVIDRRTDAWLGLGGPDLLALDGQKIGRYQLERLIAEGAMAAVYAARQRNPQRAVAIKLVRSAMPLVDSAGRFRREADALGRLQHPNIARIYEAGVHYTQRREAMPYIAMELVDGPTITQHVRKQNLTRQQRIELMIKVATAVHAAHQQAVIHRDLKPDNVLVDSTGEPKVLDFGIARIIGADDENRTWQTTAGVLLGTPAYMSPEQASGKVEQIDVRTDVWSLGVLLYEMLTDKLPLDVRDASITDILKRIETVDPIPPGKLDRSLRGDIETVVMTALSREKTLRYSSAQAMADDLKRVLEYEPIQARPPSRWYRSRKFVRRHRVSIAFVTCFVLLIAAAAIVSSVAFVRASRDRDKAQAINQFLQEMISSADPSVGSKDATVLQALQASEQRIGPTFAGSPMTEAEVRSTLGWTYFGLGEYDRANAQMSAAVEIRKRTGHGDDEACFDDESRLATILRWQYRPKEALALARSAYDRAVRVLGENHPSAITLLEPIAGSVSDLGDLVNAAREYEKVVEVNRRVLGAAHEQTQTTMNNLAVVYQDLGDYHKAEVIQRQLLEIRSKTLKPSNPALLTTRLNLAVSISEQGRYTEALGELQPLVADAEAALGPAHDSTLSVLGNYSETLVRLGRFDEAVAAQKQIVDRRLSTGRAPTELRVKDMADYSTTLLHAERLEEARAAAQSALDLALATFPADDFRVALCRGHLAAALDGLKRSPEAVELFKLVVPVMEKQFGPEGLRTLVQTNNLGMALTNAGRPTESVPILQRVLEIVQRRELSHMESAVHKNLGEALLDAKQYEEAEKQLLQSHEIATRRAEGRTIGRSAKLLARLYDETARPDKAERWRSATTQPSVH